MKDFHRRYPNEPVENLERAYKRRHPVEGEVLVSEVDNMFSGEEANGRFLDLTTMHEDYLNLPGVKRLTYLQYLDQFDSFNHAQYSVKQSSKLSDQYFNYVRSLATYLESFCRRTKPLEDLDAKFASLDAEFEKAWDSKSIPGWHDEEIPSGHTGPQTEGTGEGIWCPACQKEFKNENVYKNHLTGKKHIRAAEALKANPSEPNGSSKQNQLSTSNLKERAIADREHRIRTLADYLSPERNATRVNVERKQGMTERERQQELDALFAEDTLAPADARDPNDSDAESDSSEKIYNPLKLPLAWDGKPIPYWLYKLHGLGVEFPCEICGNFVYMGRRAFDKHFSEARHVYGLKCLGITNTGLFREITGIEDALALWEKVRRDKEVEKRGREGVVQMEDREGNVMPERVYLDLQKQGIL
jgi:splicing factor 3A subunit 3